MAHHSIYVIELDKQVLQDPKFRAVNPDYVEGKPCAYVGMTGRSPEIRFEQHKRGYRSNQYVRRFGLWLRQFLL